MEEALTWKALIRCLQEGWLQSRWVFRFIAWLMPMVAAITLGIHATGGHWWHSVANGLTASRPSPEEMKCLLGAGLLAFCLAMRGEPAASDTVHAILEPLLPSPLKDWLQRRLA